MGCCIFSNAAEYIVLAHAENKICVCFWMNKIILLQHASDREMLNLVKSQTSESTKRELLIDYLKCSESLNGDILVYSPTVSSSLDWGEILHRKVELSLLKDDNMRSAYNCLMSIIDSVANDRGGNLYSYF